jgi:hypothetical protein
VLVITRGGRARRKRQRPETRSACGGWWTRVGSVGALHARFERVREFCSYARLVKCQHESSGKRSGKSWSAFSEAAVLFLRANPEGMKYKKRLERKHGKAKSLSILAHRIGRAVFHMLKRGKAFDMNAFLAT